MSTAQENDVALQNDENPEWAKKSLRKKCECELCKSGKATSHNDDSHDQSLDQKITVAGVDLRFVGGTTKCARTMIRYFEKVFGHDQKNGSKGKRALGGKKVVEVGSGTGLVGSCLALLGAHVTLTDQSYVMEVLNFNLNKIGKSAAVAKKAFKVETKEHVWGTDTKELVPCDIVVGSDLIFALEGIRPLVKSITDMVRESRKEKADVEAYVAVIRRFEWETLYFELMDKNFDSEKVLEV
mmetsp:Transcript_5950/g.8174  ORF Transcript_5950/g.8174 Transcript_5950/m.8174 type:complete len:240 (-) Transcript_5950:522-1241(-)